MPSALRIRARALHQAAEILLDQPDGLRLQELWPRICRADPSLEADWQECGKSRSLERDLRYSSVHLVKAGWLRKTAWRWRITGLGQAALADYPKPDEFFAEARRVHAYWKANRPSFDAAADLLGDLPDGRWVDLADLAAEFGIDRGAVAACLLGTRPEGWHRALDSGEVPPGASLTRGERDEWRDLLERDELHDEAASSADVIRARPELRLSADELAALITGEADLEADIPESPRRAWLLRGTDQAGAALIRSLWQQDGICSLPAERLPELPAGVGAERVRTTVDAAYSGTRPERRAVLAAEFHAFLSRMRERDIVLGTDSTAVYLGTVTGPPRFTTAEGHARLQRPTAWHNLGTPLDFYRDLPPEMSGPLGDPDAALVELTEYAGDLETLLGTAPEQPTTAAPTEARLPDATPELAQALTMSGTDWLQECVELLRDRPQLIFYGPPGTGKTFTALALARHLTGGNPNNTGLVQFHPAYAYEGFFEGFRPRKADPPSATGSADGRAAEHSGGIAFDLVPGPLRRLADAARRRPAEVFVLVIDEINRANLAKVFGELYFLLEYREEFVHLLYGSDEGRRFRLPPNLVILGTMNTTDRTIALMDAAMRRRFAFVELHPDHEPAASMLRTWLAARDLPDDSARLLEALNRRIGEHPSADRDFRIGPSYLMRPAVHGGPRALERLWRTQILPLLAEYHWGDGTQIPERYGLDALREELGLPTGDGETR